MKTPCPRLLISGAALWLAVSGLCAVASDYSAAAGILAEKFLLQDKSGDEELEPFFKTQGIGKGEILEACKTAVKKARELKAAGAEPGKPAFQVLMQGRATTTSSADPTPARDAGSKKPKSSIASKVWPRGTPDNPSVFFHTGIRTLTPYKIDYETHKLSSDSVETSGFLEVVASNLWAWQPQRIEQARSDFEKYRLGKARKTTAALDRRLTEEAELDDAGKPKLDEQGAPVIQRALKPYTFEWLGLNVDDLTDGWDYASRLSFQFGADSEPTASTITGSGDVSAEIGFTKNLVQGWTPGGAWSAGLGGSLGAVSDRAARRVHRNVFAGINTTASFQVGDDDRLALLRIGFGWAKVDGVIYDDPMQDTIEFDGTVPAYQREWRPAAEAELWWPINEAECLTTGAKIYGRGKPDQWSLYLGYRMAIPDAIGALKPKKQEAKATE